MATKALYILPVQTDRGVFLRITFDGKELPAVGPLQDETGFLVPIEIEEEKVEEEYPKKNSARRTRQRSIRQENLIAKDIGGRRQFASGALPGRKGDAYKEGITRVEAKFTYANSYRLELNTMLKAGSEAKHGEIPAVVVDFVDKSTSKTIEKLAIVYYADWKRLINADDYDSGLPDGD